MVAAGVERECEAILVMMQSYNQSHAICQLGRLFSLFGIVLV